MPGESPRGDASAGARAVPDLLLIGLRCSGKSSLGRAIAKRHGAEFVDLDDRLATRLSCASAGDALRTHGEPTFRRVESELLAELLDPHAAAARHAALVIALGGGTPTAPGARDLLAAATRDGRARIVLLSARNEVLAERMRRSGVDRPALTALPPLDEIELLASRRLGDYRSLADSELDTSELDCESSLRALESLWTAPRDRG